MTKSVKISDEKRVKKLKKMLYALMVDCVGNDLMVKKPKAATVRKAQVLLNKLKD